METEMVGSVDDEGAALLTAEVINVSEGPRTRQRTLVLPCDMYAEPSEECGWVLMEQLNERSSLNLRPSTLIPSGEKSSNLDIGNGLMGRAVCDGEVQSGHEQRDDLCGGASIRKEAKKKIDMKKPKPKKHASEKGCCTVYTG